MTMKNISYLIAICMLLLFSSCSKQMEQLPPSAKNFQSFPGSEKEIEEYIIATYANLQSNGLYGLYFPAIGEVPSDNTFDEVLGNDGGIYSDMDYFRISSTNDILDQFWKDSYSAIQRTNVVLNRLPKVAYTSDAVKGNRAGEMKFIRGLLYFNLVRTFGDVPLAMEETSNPDSYFGKGRNSVSGVYDQIKKDIAEAIDALPASTKDQGRVIKTAAQALLGKVFLTLKDYAKAKEQLDAVRSSGAHSLAGSVSTLFDLANEDNNEFIFAVQFTSGLNGNTEGSTMFQQFSPSGTQQGAKGHNLPTRELYNQYTGNDARKDVYVKLTGAGVPFCNKYKLPTTIITDGGSNFVVIRYADVLLMLAEAENELGDSPTAITYLNRVRTRAGLSNSAAQTQVDIRAAIDLERRLELIGEGHRWFDLIRTGAAVEVMNRWFVANNTNVKVDEHFLLMPVPKSQINTDPAITQNAGYN